MIVSDTEFQAATATATPTARIATCPVNGMQIVRGSRSHHGTDLHLDCVRCRCSLPDTRRRLQGGSATIRSRLELPRHVRRSQYPKGNHDTIYHGQCRVLRNAGQECGEMGNPREEWRVFTVHLGAGWTPGDQRNAGGHTPRCDVHPDGRQRASLSTIRQPKPDSAQTP